jgi:3-oxoacyl-[acyl-carrier protein] reductase
MALNRSIIRPHEQYIRIWPDYPIKVKSHPPGSPPSAVCSQRKIAMHQPSTRVAIVTGASRGIGAAIAARLARDGFAVVLNYASNAAEAERVAADIWNVGGCVVPVAADVTDPAAVRSLFDAAEAEFGGIDVLVNNAGVMMLKPIADSDDALLERQIEVNLKGTFYGLREAGRRLRSGGRIVNLSTSVVGTKPETYGVYAATKAAVEALTAILSKELRGRGIAVNAVAPGPVATELFLHGKSPDLVERIEKMNPLERLGTPEDIAGAVSFLVGPDGGWINGQVLRANGGMV